MSQEESIRLLITLGIIIFISIILYNIIKKFIERQNIKQILQFMQQNINNKNRKDINSLIESVKNNKEDFKNE